MKKSFKLIGGLILALVLVTAAQAAVVTVSCNTTNSPANPILNSSSANLAAGAFVQVIDNTSGTVSAPLTSTGLPTANGTVIATGTLSAAGVFTKSGVSIPNGHYVYIVAWQTWNGSGVPSGKYGISAISPAMVGVSYVYKPASFATNTDINPVNPPTLSSINPTSGTQGTSPGLTITGANTAWSGNMTSAIHISGSGVTVTSASSTNPLTITANIAIASDADLGAHTVTVEGASGSATFTVNPSTTAPTITSITLKDTTTTSGYVYDTVDIKGTNFGGGSGSTTAPAGSSVQLMSEDGSYVTLPSSDVFWWQSDKIQVLIPHVVGSTYTVAGSANFKVITPVNWASSTFIIKPKVYSLSPLSGPTGTIVTITGTGFNTNTGVSFNGSIYIAASSPTPTASNESLTVTVPNGATTGQVLVGVNGQNSNTNYDWAPFDPVTFIVSGPVTLTGISLLPINPTINAGGGTLQFTATGLYSDGSTQNLNNQVVWTTGTPATASINSSGLATGLAAGTTKIAATKDTLSAWQTLTVLAPGQPIVTGISPNSGTLGTSLAVTISGANTNWSGTQTLVFSNSGITVNSANATSATTIAANISIAAGAATGAGIVTVNGTNGSATFTVNSVGPKPTAIIIDDFEGGCVGTWATQADGGYYTFQNGMITPDNNNITAKGPDASAAKNGAKGMKVLYSYVKNADTTKDWGDGWGAQLHKVLDLSSMKSVTLNIRWDGSANAINFGFQDNVGHVYVANITNSALMATSTAVNGYGQISIPVGSFAEDTTNKSRTTGAIDWTNITNYNFSYLNKGTTPNYQYIDDITAVTTDEPNPNPTPGDAPVITSITPPAAPTGTTINVVGKNFAPVQGMSTLIFTNVVTNVSYPASIISWSDTAIQARVPQATVGTYNVMVNKLAASAGVVSIQQSNKLAFQVTSLSGELAKVYPNPFDPIHQPPVNIVFTPPAGVTNIGVYIYDMTARLVSKTSISASQTTWDGRDQNGQLVGDGVYLLRVVNEDTKSLIAKGKILVVKH
jgi:hypothetical protein